MNLSGSQKRFIKHALYWVLAFFCLSLTFHYFVGVKLVSRLTDGHLALRYIDSLLVCLIFSAFIFITVIFIRLYDDMRRDEDLIHSVSEKPGVTISASATKDGSANGKYQTGHSVSVRVQKLRKSNKRKRQR